MSSGSSWLRRRWYRVLHQLANRPDFYETTAATYAYHQHLMPLINKYSRGHVLDLGCGRQTYRQLLLQAGAERYTGIDIAIGPNGLDALASADAIPFADGSMNTVFCTQVFEHVKNPWQVAREIERVLAPGGYLMT